MFAKLGMCAFMAARQSYKRSKTKKKSEQQPNGHQTTWTETLFSILEEHTAKEKTLHSHKIRCRRSEDRTTSTCTLARVTATGGILQLKRQEKQTPAAQETLNWKV